MRKRDSNKLIKGIAFLAVAGVIVKILGAFFRIPLGNIIGASGMAVYQPAYSIYAVAVAFATVGLPVAISKVMSREEGNEDNHALRMGIEIAIFVALPISVMLFIFAPIIENILGIDGVTWSLRAVCPAIVFLTLTASFRGYFQGHGEMRPTGISQVVEQLTRVSLGIVLSVLLYKAFDDSEIFGAFGAIIGSSIGVFVGTVLISGFYLKERKTYNFRIKGRIREDFLEVKALLKMAVFITIGAAIFQIFTLAETPIIVNRLLASGMEIEKATSLYGELSGMVYPIINIPYIMVASISIGIIPKLAELNAKEINKDKDENTEIQVVNKGVKLAATIGLPAGVGLILIGKDILSIFYPTLYEEFAITDNVIRFIGVTVIALSITQVIMGILQGTSNVRMSLISVCLGIVAKVTTSVVLVEYIGIEGAPISSFIGCVVILIVGIYYLKKIKIKINWWSLKVPLLGVVIMTTGVITVKSILEFYNFNIILETIVALMVALILYSTTILVKKNEILK